VNTEQSGLSSTAQSTAIALHAPAISSPVSLKRSLGWKSLLCVVYVTVCAGPFGLEEFVTAVGPGMAFILLLIIPILWGLPLLFMSAELSSALPVEGGLYRWVKTAFGDFWGFQAGWWWWISSFLDCAIYAVLVADYFAFFNPEMSKLAHWGIALAVIWFFTLLNIRGVELVGTSSLLFVLFMTLPFIVMIVAGAPKISTIPLTPILPEGKSFSSVLSTGLLMGIWFISGFEGVGTAAEEIKNSERAIARALVLIFPLVLASYGLPILVSLAVDPNWQSWGSGHFAKIAEKIGGPALGGWVSIAGVISNMALFSTWLLSYSRLPFAMAHDGYLPKAITRVSPKYGTPFTAIVLSGVIYSIFAWGDFQSLVIINIWVILCGIFLEFLALAKLRFSRPDLPRYFRVPGGRIGLWLTVICPVAVGLFAMFAGESKEIIAGSIAVATGPIAFWLCKKFVKSRND
jgi:amino acid transporter